MADDSKEKFRVHHFQTVAQGGEGETQYQLGVLFDTPRGSSTGRHFYRRILFTLTLALPLCFVVGGCMSIEDRLASADLQVRDEAERELWENSKKDPDVEKRIKAIGMIRNEELLFHIAKEDLSKRECEAAVSRMSNRKFLVRLPKESSNKWVASAVISRLDDEQDLADVMIATAGTSAEEFAYAKIKNGNQRRKLAKASTSMNVKKAYFASANDKLDALSLFDLDSTVTINACLDFFVDECGDVKVLNAICEKTLCRLTLAQAERLSQKVQNEKLVKRIGELEEAEKMGQFNQLITGFNVDSRIDVVDKLKAWNREDYIMKFLLTPPPKVHQFERPVSGMGSREQQYYLGLLELMEKVNYKNYPILKRFGVFSTEDGWLAIEKVEERWFQTQFK